MASGTRQINVPTNQRLLSTDINRLQRFQSADMVELLNYWLLAQTDDDGEGNGEATFQTTTGNPLFGMVLNGLVFQPGISTANSNVSQGLLVVCDPDGSPDPDDSPIKYIRAAASNTLTLTPNSSGSTRIDVVEVQRANTIVETSTVDIFDTSTGFFSPASETKAIQSTLNYRIRTGANGGGFPGTASGWLPIAVCSVPTGTTTWDTVEVWDVRPLAVDRTLPPFNALRNLSGITKQSLYLSATSNGSSLLITGYTEGSLDGWRMGGAIHSSSSGGKYDLETANFKEPGTTYSANNLYAVYLALPHSLPRWVRYSPAAFGSRKPRGMRGFPILSTKIPTEQKGGPPSNLVMPTGYGFTSSSNGPPAICIAVGYGTFLSGNPDNMVADSYMQHCFSHGAPVAASNIVASTVNFSLTAGTHFPGNASRIRVRFSTSATWASGYAQFSISTAVASQLISDELANGEYPTDGTSLFVEMDIPVYPAYPSSDTFLGRTVVVGLTYGGTVGGLTIDATAANHTIQVVGWHLGP